MFDDEPAKKSPSHMIGADLSALSIEELEKRISALRAEILRLEEAVSAKRAFMASAENFFKK